MVTLFLRQGENGKQVLLSFPTTTPAEKEDVDRTLETLKSMSKTVTIQGAASEVMNLGLYLSGVDLAAEGELERINQLADRLEHEANYFARHYPPEYPPAPCPLAAGIGRRAHRPGAGGPCLPGLRQLRRVWEVPA